MVNNFKTLRQAAGYTQQGLATELGVSISAVRFWESGTHMPDGASRIGIACVLDCSVEDLITEGDKDHDKAAA